MHRVQVIINGARPFSIESGGGPVDGLFCRLPSPPLPLEHHRTVILDPDMRAPLVSPGTFIYLYYYYYYMH